MLAYDPSETVSRVLSRTVIYLGRPSPDGSSRPPQNAAGRRMVLLCLASDGVYICPGRYRPGGSLLHCLSTLTRMRGRSVSVALALESPPPDVIRHPAL